MSRLANRYLIAWLILLSTLAWQWPAVWSSLRGVLPERAAAAARADFDPFVESRRRGDEDRPYLTWVIVATMFCVGSLLPGDEVRELARRWPSVLGGTSVQYLSMPLLAYLFARLFELPRELLIGVVMVGCVPGAMASNVLTRVAQGNVSYSVSLTTMATLVSPAVVPAALWLTLGTTVPPAVFAEASLRLLIEVVVPVLTGFTLCRLSARLDQFMRRAAGTIANLCILWIIAVVVALNRERIADASGPVFAILLLLNACGYLAGHLGGRLLRLPDGMRKALILEVGMQNAGVGAKLSLDLFQDAAAAAIPPAVYAFGCMLTGTVLAQWLGRRDREPPR